METLVTLLRTFVWLPALVLAVESTIPGACADDATYVETSGYRDVLAAVSRLKTEGAKLSAASREKLAAEGQSLIKLEESYKPGTRPLQQEAKRSEAKSKMLQEEAKALEQRKKTLEGDPKRTQEQIDVFNAAANEFSAHLNEHGKEVAELNSRIDADNLQLEKSYAAFTERVSAAFLAVATSSYVAKDPKSFAEQKVGDGECVAFARKAAGLSTSSTWREGAKVKGNDIPKGTAIATFVEKAYPQSFPKDGRRMHAAIYDGQDRDGIWVWDQWAGKSVSRRHIRFQDGKGVRSNDADAYAVIETKK